MKQPNNIQTIFKNNLFGSLPSIALLCGMIAKIQKGKPMPKANAVGRKSKYPFKDMEIGDSIYGEVATSSLLASATNWAKRNKSTFEFVAEKEKRGARVWRIK